MFKSIDVSDKMQMLESINSEEGSSIYPFQNQNQQKQNAYLNAK